MCVNDSMKGERVLDERGWKYEIIIIVSLSMQMNVEWVRIELSTDERCAL